MATTVSLIPLIREVTASSVSALDQLTAIKNAMATAPERRWRVASFNLNGSSQVTALMLEYGDMQLCLRATSTTQLLCSLHPEGGVTNISAPSTATGSTERSIDGYLGTNLLPLTDGRIQIGELEGVISIFFRRADGNWVAGIHAGQIYYPEDISDEENGFEGYGLLIGRPGIWQNNTGFTSSANFGRGCWLNLQLTLTVAADYRGSLVRVMNQWVIPRQYACPNQFAAEDDPVNPLPNDVNGNLRLPPIKIAARTETDNTVQYHIGSLRFLRLAKTPPVQIVDSDQYWWNNQVKNTTTNPSSADAYDIRNLVHVWNKNFAL
jgi:hypothetical protein